jgi:hypothetical protein
MSSLGGFDLGQKALARVTPSNAYFSGPAAFSTFIQASIVGKAIS